MFVGFTDDAAKMIVGTAVGFQLFQLPGTAGHTGGFIRTRNEQTLGGVSHVALHTQSTLVAVVGTTGRPGVSLIPGRCVILMDLATADVVSQLHFDELIVGLKINQKRLVVVTPKATHVFDLETLDPLPLVRTTNPLNDSGVVALSPWSPLGDSCWLVVPQSLDSSDASRGDIILLEAGQFQRSCAIPAHRSAVTQVEFCSYGTRFATTSAKGNVVRLFSTTGQLLCVFRRGQQEAWIYALSLNADGTVVAATSSSGTLHVFKDEGRSESGAAAEGVRSVAKLHTRTEKTVCCVSPDGTTITVVSPPLLEGSMEQGNVRQFHIETLKMLHDFPF